MKEDIGAASSESAYQGVNVLGRVIFALLSLLAAVVFAYYLYQPQDLPQVEFLHELPPFKWLNIYLGHASGLMLLNWSYFISAITGCLACLLAIILCLSSSQRYATNT